MKGTGQDVSMGPNRLKLQIKHEEALWRWCLRWCEARPAYWLGSALGGGRLRVNTWVRSVDAVAWVLMPRGM